MSNYVISLQHYARYAAVLFLSYAASVTVHAAAITPADLAGTERITTFEGIIGFDTFTIVANVGQKWDYDDALFSHTGTFAGLALSTRIPLTGGTNTVMLAQVESAGILVEFDVPVGLAGATVFNDRARASFYNSGGVLLGSDEKNTLTGTEFVGWSAEPGTGWIKSILFEDLQANNLYGFAIDNIVRGNPVPVPPALLLFAPALAGMYYGRRGRRITP